MERPQQVNEGTGHQLDPEDPRILDALDEYMALLDAGKKPDQQEFLDRHAPVARALAEYLASMDMLNQVSSNGSINGKPAKAREPEREASSLLGDFQIIRVLGRGGMGVVYEAEQISLKRRIALKVLPYSLTLDPKQLQRFKNEARAAAQLHHPHIVPVFSIGEEKGAHFYAMQFIDGQSLAELIQKLRSDGLYGSSISKLARQLSPSSRPSRSGSTESTSENKDLVTTKSPSGGLASPTTSSGILKTVNRLLNKSVKPGSSDSQFFKIVARLGNEAAKALEYAHGYGVIHRDIKPGNLLLNEEGKLWLTDFGLAQFQTDSSLTATGDMLGTLRYMSPEQAGRKNNFLDHRTDIYSLGATLYELATLKPPFDGNDHSMILQAILKSEPYSPRSINKAIPRDLETIILKAMAKNPDDRYGTAQEMADDLERFLKHETILARRATLLQKAYRWGLRNPGIVASTLILSLLTATAAIVTAMMVQSSNRHLQESLEREEEIKDRLRKTYYQQYNQKQVAEKRYELARGWVSSMQKFCNDEMTGLPELEGVRSRMLEAIMEYNSLLKDNSPEDDLEEKEFLSKLMEEAGRKLADIYFRKADRLVPLLRLRGVQEDLKLSKTHSTQVDQIARKRAELIAQLSKSNDSLEARREKYLEIATQTNGDLLKILTREQEGRLYQIELQTRGMKAFDDTYVTMLLKLVAVQREQIRIINNPSMVAIDPVKPKPGDPIESEAAKVKRVVNEVLTKAQAEQWNRMVGAPYQGLSESP